VTPSLTLCRAPQTPRRVRRTERFANEGEVSEKRLAVTRTIYDKFGNAVRTQSAEYQICTFKVKNTTTVYGCSHTHKNTQWVLRPVINSPRRSSVPRTSR